jgi:GTP-binding protein
VDFVDQVKIYVKAGDGGNGVRSFRREKHVPYGGPDGGDGGHGGDIVLEATERMSTLLDLQFQQHHIAKGGGHGEGSNRHGRSAPAHVIRVPVGTIARELDTDDILADLTEDGQRAIIAHAGRGGRGNARFASSTNRVPTKCEPGTRGEEHWLQLELKLLADVGLVGYPNAGKSTLISAISAARPKIADYPFTTLVPNLGVVAVNEDQSFVIADVPGLIEGAHEGKGLGFQFLRHIERTSYLMFLVDVSEGVTLDPVESLQTLRQELKLYNPDLAKKPFAVAATKLDVAGDCKDLKKLEAHCRRRRLRMFPISAVTGAGLKPLVRFLGKAVQECRRKPVGALLCERPSEGGHAGPPLQRIS